MGSAVDNKQTWVPRTYVYLKTIFQNLWTEDLWEELKSYCKKVLKSIGTKSLIHALNKCLLNKYYVPILYLALSRVF